MKKAKIVFLFAFAVLFDCAIVHADSLSLPLNGYFHPGRAMPVSWRDSQDVQLSASGAITTHIDSVVQSRGVFPWIAIGSPVSNISDHNLPQLHPLEDSDALVGIVDEDDSDTVALFSGRRLVPIHLDPDEIQGPAMAWETLDGLIISADAWEKIPGTLRAGLYAEGVEVIVPGDARPDADLPWLRTGIWWIALARLNLPPIVSADAYLPVAGWTSGRDEGFRRRILFSGAIFCLLICGVGLWRSRWMPAGMIAISVLAGLAFALENQSQSPISRVGGVVRLVDGENQFEDQWVYQVSHRDVGFKLPIENSVCPFFFDSSQMAAMDLVIECDGTGLPVDISGRLKADEPFGVMSRRIATSENSSLVPATSPLRLLVTGSIYPGFSVAGQVGGETAQGVWPTVVAARR